MVPPRQFPRSASRSPRRLNPRGKAALFATFSMAALLACPTRSQAVAYSWNVAGDGNWNVPANYLPNNASPVAGDTVLFNNPAVTANERIFLNGNQAATLVNFGNTGTTTLLGGTAATALVNTLTLTAGMNVLAGAGAVTIGDSTASAPTDAVNLVLGGSQTFSNNSASTLTLANGVANSGTTTVTLSITGTGNTTFGGLIANGATGALALAKNGAGTLTLTGTLAATNTGATSLTGGTVVLDYSQGIQRLSTAALTLGGTTINLSGASGTPFTQTVASTQLNAGASTIARTNGGNATLALGNLTRSVGGTLNLTAGSIATTTTANANATAGILGGHAVVGTLGDANWAVGATTAGTVTAITALPTASYAAFPATGASGTTNYLLTGSGTSGTQTPYSLKINTDNTGQSLAITAGTTLGLAANGLLFVGANPYEISGGTLRGNANQELIVQQFGAGNLTVSSVLGLGTGQLVKAGPGTLTVTGANTYTGATYVLAGTLATGGTTLTPFGTSATSTVFVGDGATLNLSNGASQAIPALASTTTGGSSASVVLGATNLTLGSATAATFNGTISGTGNVTKVGTAAQGLTGQNSYTGITTISGGTLNTTQLANGGANSGVGASSNAAMNLVLDGGALGYIATNQTPGNTDRLFTLTTNGGTLDSSGNSLPTGTAFSSSLNFTNAGAIVLAGAGAHTLTLTGTNNVGSTFAPQLTNQSAAAPTSVVKTGAGTWTLTNANNMYSGGTAINLGQIIAPTPGVLGTGPVTLLGGVSTSLVLTGAGTYTNALFVGASTASAGNGALQLFNGANLGGAVTMTGGAGTTFRVGGTNSTGTISGQISGAANLDFFTNGTNVSETVTLSNPLNNYTGDTTLQTFATSGGVNQTVILGASNVIPNGAGTGNLSLNVNYSTGNAVLQLNGFNETLNGLNSGGGGAEQQGVVQNQSATVGTSTLTLGDNNAVGNYIGVLRNNSANSATTGLLAVAKTGSGTQTLGGTSTLTGGVAVNQGTLTEDFNQYTATQSVTPSNYLPAATAVTLNGGTFSETGRGNAVASTITSSTFTSRNNGIIVTAAQAAAIVPGQMVTTTFGGATVFYVTYVDRLNNIVYFNSNSAISATSGVANTYNFMASTGAASSQTLGGVTVASGASGINVNANGASAVLNLGAITRNVGGTVDLTLPAGTQGATNGVTTTSTSVSNGVLTSAAGAAYATVGGTDWASVPTTGTARSITALAAYNANSFTTADNSDVSGAQAPGSSFTVNTLRFNAAGGTLDVSGGAATVSTGGILVTAATAGNAATINNTGGDGFLRAGAGNELVIVNNGALNVSAPVVNGTAGNSALTISGVGTTTFTGANTFSGPTTLNGGTYTPGLVYTNAGGAAALPVGTVFVNNGVGAGAANGLGTGALVVNQNAVLAGNGSLNNITTTFNGGSTVSPGATAGGIGVLSLTSTTTTFTGSSGSLSTLAMNVAADGTSDLLRIVGNLDLSSAFDQIVVTGVTGAGSYQLATFTGTLTGSFDAVSVPTNYQLAYVAAMGATPGSINLVTTIPEPGTWAASLVLLAGTGYAVRRHRRKTAV